MTRLVNAGGGYAPGGGFKQALYKSRYNNNNNNNIIIIIIIIITKI